MENQKQEENWFCEFFIPKVMQKIFNENRIKVIFLFFTIIFLALWVFPPSSSYDTMRYMLSTLIISQITVITIFFALAIFSAEFVSGTTSPYLVHLIITDSSLIKRGFFYSLCVLFEIILLMGISGTDNIILIVRQQIDLPNIYSLNISHSYPFLIYISIIMSCLCLLSILKKYAGFFSTEAVIEKMFSHMEKEIVNNQIIFGINHTMIFDSLNNLLQCSKYVTFKKFLFDLWDHDFKPEYSRDSSYELIFFEQIDNLITIALNRYNYGLIESIFEKLGKESQNITNQEVITYIFKIYRKNCLILINSDNASLCYDITKSMEEFIKGSKISPDPDYKESVRNSIEGFYYSQCQSGDKKLYELFDDINNTLNS